MLGRVGHEGEARGERQTERHNDGPHALRADADAGAGAGRDAKNGSASACSSSML